MEALEAQAAGQLELAETRLRSALMLAPGRESLLVNLAGVLIEAGKIDAAVPCCEQVLAANPAHAQAWMNLALCHYRADRSGPALEAIRRSLALEASAAAFGNLGNILIESGQTAEALAAFDEAVRLEPEDAAWHTARGTALRMLERLPEAAAAHHTALRIDPDCADAHWNLAGVDLTEGRYEAGWRGFEWRWRTTDPVRAGYHGTAPRWQGQPLAAGENLLLWAEQGLGDTLQFCRYASVLAGRGWRVILQVQPPLLRLLQRMDPRVEVVSSAVLPPRHDWQCPLMSVAGLCATRADSIPAAEAYLAVPEASLALWQARLGPATRPRIGLMWQGNLQNRTGRGRSLPAAALAPLMALPCDFFFVGKEAAAQDLAELRRHGTLADHSAAIADFADTAAQIALMDRVITIDTSVAHLAAGLGRPTLILLGAGADWRWGTPGARSTPWYPRHATLYRQQPGADWAPAVAALTADLAAWLSS
ncbi:tetratricopeptide repeat-containing glycosyltransferase family protein [Uliginosibacterium paludis]|uniref:Tetratricopeptide repeat-containing glycosyltransferase family protein n=1 Tax=Uliginosibacterium paludis TaxID=1615952 RepID=A0ABV2CPP4_9RHOO